MPGSSKARTEFSNSTGPVLWSIDERGVASVVLNRPEVNNAYDGGLVDGLLRATDALKGLTDLRLILIRGNGRHFQAGADLKWIDAVAKSSREENISASRATAEAVRRLNLSPVPTLALVQGGCFGGGTGIIAACDVVIAADNAMFSISEVRWGLTAAIILPQLIHGIGLRQLRRYALTGERFGAEDARRIGLVHEVVPLSDLESAGTRMIGHFLDNGPNAITETKMLALGLA
ncbi:MAG: enoyl-CoA hydratase/isomerase family protein, partial [Hyphomicrobiales bacterium]|nr:enoyl-CoA hydratase/isomerase family protein [Hyphomicrobiales bacterium]